MKDLLPPPSSLRRPLPTRVPLIDLTAGFGRHWYAGCPYRTQYYNALSMSFPAGEQEFIASVREMLAFLPNGPQHDQLRQTCHAFIAQEATHRRLHELFNAQLAQYGLHNVWERWIKRLVALAQRTRLHPRNRLAVTAAFEHFTAVWASTVLEDPHLFDDVEEQVRILWLWHASEEAEHKAVAFDLYEATGGWHGRRVLWYFYVLLQFVLFSHAQTWLNLWRDGSWWWPRTWWGAWSFWFAPPRGARGMFWRVALPFLAYPKRGFHPLQLGTYAQEQSWLRANPDCYRVIKNR